MTEVTLGAGGLMELWPNCYTAGQGASAVYDAPGLQQMVRGQRYARDIGIGNQPACNPDWTFTASATSFTIRKLQAFILP